MVMDTDETRQLANWRVIGGSVQGSAHIREGKPKQDQIYWWPESGVGLPLVLVVADGHGGESHFRSHIGASLAVKITIDILVKFAEQTTDESNFELIKKRAERELAKTIYSAWRAAVADEIYENPLTKVELELVEKVRGTARKRQVTLDPALAYGATLLSVLITDKYILYLQLGDGDILTVDEKDQVMKAIPRNEELLGDETFSLSLNNAWKDFSVHFEPLIADNSLALILLSTDGYRNSFIDESGFMKIGTDYRKLIRENGVDNVASKLESWLSMTSANGSGDDISLGLICRTDVSSKPVEKATNENMEATQVDTEAKKNEDAAGILQDGKKAQVDSTDNNRRQNE